MCPAIDNTSRHIYRCKAKTSSSAGDDRLPSQGDPKQTKCCEITYQGRTRASSSTATLYTHGSPGKQQQCLTTVQKRQLQLTSIYDPVYSAVQNMSENHSFRTVLHITTATRFWLHLMYIRCMTAAGR